MQPWIRRWLDWAMSEVLPSRSRPSDQAVHVHYEKAGLQLLGPPVPWNADAVLVELLAKLPPSARVKTDFQLRIPGWPVFTADSVRLLEGQAERCRVYFKLPVPTDTVQGELLWKQRLLTSLTILVQSSTDYLAAVRLNNPTLALRLKDSTTCAAQTYIAPQCQGVIAAAVLRSPRPLVPLAEIPLQVRFDGVMAQEPITIRLTAAQLASKECLVLASPPKVSKRVGPSSATWLLNGQELHKQPMLGLSRSRFIQSLRVSETRYVWSDLAGRIQVTRQAPAPGLATRLGPCFILASREMGAAGILPFSVTALFPNAARTTLVHDQPVLITDGPTVLAPGLVDLSESPGLYAFELRSSSRVIGTAPLSPIPQAKFTSEGGFQAPTDFQWNSLADEELTERMNKLFGEG